MRITKPQLLHHALRSPSTAVRKRHSQFQRAISLLFSFARTGARLLLVLSNHAANLNLKPAPLKALLLLKKLQALAEKGIDGEKISAQNKIARLKLRYDFSLPEEPDTPDLFSGSFKKSTKARPIGSFGAHEMDVASSVKWAIESATNIRCVLRGSELLAESNPPTANRLSEIATHIAGCFRSLTGKFSELSGASSAERSAFLRGLYDGMMNETRDPGQPLPRRYCGKKSPKLKKRPVVTAAGVHIHPYTVAVSLGKQIRFSAPLEEITAELEAVAQKHLAQAATARK
jgi:hypothetical protein